MGKKKVVGSAGITAGGHVTIKDVTGQLAIGDYINQFKIEKPTGEALIKLLDYLDQKRQESVNKEILNSYTPSALPDYPPRLRVFVTENRVDELTQALIYLQDHRILLISGIGGVGKTTLARGLIETRPANVPLPFWFDFSKKMDAKLGDLLEKLASYMNTPDIASFRKEGREAGQEDINRLTGELQKIGLIWLVFDNLETILDGVYFRDRGIDSLFTSLRGSMHQAKVIVTSRTLPLLGNGESIIDVIEEEKKELKGLKINYAVDYLSKNGLDGVERAKLEELAKGVDGHPLALKLLIELVKKFGVSDTLNDLSMYQRRKEDTIKKARRLFDKLAGDEKELLERISVYRQPESMTAIKKMFTDKTSKDAVEKLIDKSLLETDHKGNYWLHPLVREFSYDDLRDKVEVHKLAYHYYLALPVPEKRTKMEDVQTLVEAHHHACMAKEYDKAARIIFDNYLHQDLDMWGSYRTLVELYVRVLPKDHLRDKPLLSELVVHSKVLGNLGSAYYALGNAKKAIEYYKKALNLSADIDDVLIEASNLTNLGIASFYLGEFSESITALEEARSIYERQKDDLSKDDLEVYGICLDWLGVNYRNDWKLQKGKEFHEKALKIAKRVDNRRLEAHVIANLGAIHLWLKEYSEVINCWENSLKISKSINDLSWVAHYTIDVGYMYFLERNYDDAIKYLEEGTKIAQESYFEENIARGLMNQGSVWFIRGDIKRATKCYEEALQTAKMRNIAKLIWRLQHNIGNIYRKQGNYKKAYEQYLNSIGSLEEMAATYDSEKEKKSFFMHRLEPFRSMILLCLAVQKDDEAMEFAKRGKQESLIDFLNRRRGSVDLYLDESKNRNFFDGYYVVTE